MSVDKNYHFRVSDAVEYGVEEAIILNNFRFSIDGHRANGTHFYEGRWWTFDSVRAYCLLYPFWTTRQMCRIIKSLIDQKVIMTGNFNKMKYDQTHWYAFVDQENMLFLPISPKGELDQHKQEMPILPNGEMGYTEPGNGIVETVKPIPTLIPTHNPSKTKENDAEDGGAVAPAPSESSDSLFSRLLKIRKDTNTLPPPPVKVGGKLSYNRAHGELYGLRARAELTGLEKAEGLEAATEVFAFAARDKWLSQRPVVPSRYTEYKTAYMAKHTPKVDDMSWAAEAIRNHEEEKRRKNETA